MKTPICKYCGSKTHYSFRCFRSPKNLAKLSVGVDWGYARDKTIASVVNQINKKPVSRRKQLIKELDSVFSEYIRLRDSDNGFITCVTCGSTINWKVADNCHFISRGKIGTRYNETNCHAGCRHCNRYLSGNLEKYENWLKNEYGDDIIELLRNESYKIIATNQLEYMLADYKDKLKALRINKA